MIDFQVVFPVEVVPISQVRPVFGLSVRTLDITGSDFTSVDEVLMNEVPSPSFVPLGRNRLLAEVPDVLKQSTVTSLSVISRRMTITSRSVIRFRVSNTPSKVRGILRLVQLFLKVLLTTPGTDIFARGVGGGALRKLGHTVGLEEGADISSHFVISVDNTVRQIIQIQGREQATPPDEKLLAATVQSVGFNRNETALLATVEILSQAGESAVTRVEW